MDPLTWTGAVGALLNLPFQALVIVFVASVAALLVSYAFGGGGRALVQRDGSVVARMGPHGVIASVVRYTGLALIALTLTYASAGVVLGPEWGGIVGGMSRQLSPVFLLLIVTFWVSIRNRDALGLYGKLFTSTVGMIGFGLVMFWVFAGVLAGPLDLIATHDPLSQVSGMKNKIPGTPLRGAEEGEYGWYLLGGDNLARDVFSRLFEGAWIVIQIAPLATVFAFMAGITLGLPAGYFGGRLDVLLSFVANLILAFPVILLFYLLVTPEIKAAGVPAILGLVLFIFPVFFVTVLLNSRYRTQPRLRTPLIAVTLTVMLWAYLSLNTEGGYLLNTHALKVPGLPGWLDAINPDPAILLVFVSVVFVNAPTVFRIVRGITLDIKTRDYVAAARTRGEGAWYIMLWEILPNARGPLIVDFCLRIGYTTILLGTLGFFGLGLQSESPDWGTTINAGRRLLSLYPHAAIVPALALMSLVLGLNLLADGLREKSLED
jgi:peptide/nickel transport system permease protein